MAFILQGPFGFEGAVWVRAARQTRDTRVVTAHYGSWYLPGARVSSLKEDSYG